MSFVKNPRSGTVMCWQLGPAPSVSPELMPGVGMFKASHGDECAQISLATMPHPLSSPVVILNKLSGPVAMQCCKLLCSLEKLGIIIIFNNNISNYILAYIFN